MKFYEIILAVLCAFAINDLFFYLLSKWRQQQQKLELEKQIKEFNANHPAQPATETNRTGTTQLTTWEHFDTPLYGYNHPSTDKKPPHK